jgi:dolichol kinase
MDEKDSSASGGGIAVTHIALIMGCAFPCWVYQLLQQTTSLLCDNKMLALLPYLGLVVLGIGDSVGAICGIIFGRHHWPSSTRTMEGSVCMLLSMVLVILSIDSNTTSQQNNSSIMQFTYQVSVTMFVMTLLEASTSQTDNLCLPIAGSTLMLLLGGGICL